jgi:AcrR family transcriptional regulator
MDGVEADWRCERRERLLEGASRVFARMGYEKSSMDEIASEAGVGKPTLYRYFDGKAALFAAVFIDALDRLEAQLEAVMRREPDVEGRLLGMLRALIPTFRDHLVSLRVLSEDAAAIDQSKRRIFRERKTRIAGYLAKALAHPGATADPERAAHLVIGMIWSGTGSIKASDEELAAEIAHMALRGIEARPTAGRPSAGRSAPVARAATRAA